MFVDSHAHLEGERFDADREQVLARAKEAGVETIVAIGSGDWARITGLRDPTRGKIRAHVCDDWDSSP